MRRDEALPQVDDGDFRVCDDDYDGQLADSDVVANLHGNTAADGDGVHDQKSVYSDGVDGGRTDTPTVQPSRTAVQCARPPSLHHPPVRSLSPSHAESGVLSRELSRVLSRSMEDFWRIGACPRSHHF